jgi:hypothetical protein
MPINWGPIDTAIENAANKTTADLARRLAAVTRLTDDDVKELFPEKADAEKLRKLIEIVKSADNRNTRINKLVANIEGLAGTVIDLIGRVA